MHAIFSNRQLRHLYIKHLYILTDMGPVPTNVPGDLQFYFKADMEMQWSRVSIDEVTDPLSWQSVGI